MSQNSPEPGDQSVGHPSEERRRRHLDLGQKTDAPTGLVVISSEPVLWRLVVPDERTVLFPGNLCYKTIDPYAVCLTFRVDEDTLDWVFARTLLMTGLLEPTGAGDVEISPSRHHGVDTIQITLKAHSGYAVLEAPTQVIAAFLKRTYTAVPLGTENRHLDLDDLARRLVQAVG